MIVSSGMDIRTAIFPLVLSMMSLHVLEDIWNLRFRRQHDVLLNPDDTEHCDSEIHVQEHQGRTDSQNSSNVGHERQNSNDGELVPQWAHEIYNITFFEKVVVEELKLFPEFTLGRTDITIGYLSPPTILEDNNSRQFQTTKARGKRKIKHKDLQCQRSHVYTGSASLWIISSLELLVIIAFIFCFRRRLRSSILYLYAKLTMRLRQSFTSGGGLTSLYVSHLDDIDWVRGHLFGPLAGMLELDLVIEEKDFIPGNFQADNVVNAIFNTDAMLCVVTKEFLRNEIKIWELEIARSHTLQHPRHTLILLLKDKVTVNDFPLSFQGSWYKVHTIKWYKLKQSNRQFIEKLKKMLFSDVRRSFVGDAPV